MKLVQLSLLSDLFFLSTMMCLASGSISNDSVVDKCDSQHQLTNSLKNALSLFCSDLIHSCTVILYGVNINCITENQNYIIKHLHHNIQTIKWATKVSENKSKISTVDARSFKDVLASCLQCFYIEQRVIIYVQPVNVDQTKEILQEINSFYVEYPAKSFTIYFIISWPFQYNLSGEVNLGMLQKTVNIEIEDVLKQTVANASLMSNLYILTNINISKSSNKLQAQKNNEWGFNEFYSVYGKYVFQTVNLLEDEVVQLVVRRNDFRGTTIRAIVQESDTAPLFASFNEVNGKLEFKGGISYSFLQPMSEDLNFKLELINGTGWIAQDSNRSLMGMGKQLLTNQGDMILSLSEIVLFRIEQLAASHPTIEFKVNAYFRQPPRGLYRDIYLQAFSPDLWAIMIVTWIVIVVCLILFTSIKKKLRIRGSSDDDDDVIISIDAVSWAIATACQTGWHSTPKSTSIQIIVICGLVSSLVYYTAYSASIISIFSVELNQFETLEDLSRQGFKLYGNTHSWTGHSNIEKQAEQDGESLKSRLLEIVPGLKKIQDSQAAYLTSLEFFFFKATQGYIHYAELCKLLSKLPGYIDRQYSGWYFRKFDPLKKFLDLQITRWKEPGLIFRTNMNHARSLPAPCDPKKRETIPLEILDVRSAFLVLLAGYICSTCVLGIEIMIHVKLRGFYKSYWLHDSLSSDGLMFNRRKSI